MWESSSPLGHNGYDTACREAYKRPNSATAATGNVHPFASTSYEVCPSSRTVVLDEGRTRHKDAHGRKSDNCFSLPLGKQFLRPEHPVPQRCAVPCIG